MKNIITILSIVCLSSCCCQEQGAPALRPMPKCEVNYAEDIIEIPVKVGK